MCAFANVPVHCVRFRKCKPASKFVRSCANESVCVRTRECVFVRARECVA